MPSIHDPSLLCLPKDTNLAAMYNAQSYPIYVLVDRDGSIAGEQRGAAGETGLRRLLKRAGSELRPKRSEAYVCVFAIRLVAKTRDVVLGP
jgi:hypothetical protein